MRGMMALDEVVAQARRGAGGLLDVLLPPRCLGCRGAVDRQGLLCAGCWRQITFITAPYCAVCGLPFGHDEGAAAVCAACLARPPRYDRARAATVYDDGTRPLLLGFKLGDRTEVAGTLGRWLALAGAELLADADLVAPVPLHRWRLWRRRFNQSAMLAWTLAHQSRVEAVPDLLLRRRATRTQRGLSRPERRRNVAGAFALRAAHAGRVKGARVLLVDDVLTTGATVEEAARVLRRAGARRVDVLTFARVVRAGP
jgi:ComF family protein